MNSELNTGLTVIITTFMMGIILVYKKTDGLRWIVLARPKFRDITANRTASEKNFFFLRYADVIMILTEAANELGNTGETISNLNLVRTRAGLPELVGRPNQEQLRNLIVDERAREFVREFQSKIDLSRWNKLVDAIQSISSDHPAGATNVKPHHVLFPVPYDEIVKNSNLSQNPRYN